MMKHKSIFTIILLASILSIAFKTDNTYTSYCNSHFQFCIDYPKDFTAQGEAGNGDGQVFLFKAKQTRIPAYSLTSVHGQNYTNKVIDQLQGIWIREGQGDTSLIIINGNKLEFNYKGSRNWDPPHTINITNKIPELPGSIYDCGFIELVSAFDSLHYKILELTDSMMRLTKYSISKSAFTADDGKPTTYIDALTLHYRKTKGLPKGYNLKASVFGTWWDEATGITLKADSIFSIAYSKDNFVYSTCGKFSFNRDYFVLKDIRDKKQTMHPIDCDDLKKSAIEERWGVLKIKHLLFDANNEIHLYYGSLGLWLKETHMTLTKMR